MKNQIEGGGSKRRQVRHIAAYTSEQQILAFRNVEMLAQLLVRKIEADDVSASRRENRCLLSPSRRKTKHGFSKEFRKPFRRYCLRRREYDAPSPIPSSANNIRGDGR